MTYELQNILNVAYKSTRLELSSLTIWNYEKKICVMYFSIEGNECLTLNGDPQTNSPTMARENLL